MRLAAAALLLYLGTGSALTGGTPRRTRPRPRPGGDRTGDGTGAPASRSPPGSGGGNGRKGPRRGASPARAAGGSPYLGGDTFDHSLLTKEEEVLYGRRVVRARELRDAVSELVRSRELEPEAWDDSMELDDVLRECDKACLEILREGSEEDDEDGDGGPAGRNDVLSRELEHLSVYGYRPPPAAAGGDDGPLPEHLGGHLEQLSGGRGGDHGDGDASFEYGPRRRAGRGATAAERRDYTPLLRVPLGKISDDDAVTHLGLPGGKRELLEALLEGTDAREALMRRNAKLVVSISRTWLRRAYSTEGANGGGSMYDGSWDRPSLDEAVQEGMIGLARAADKYDPERGLRFATYATHWITSMVRLCFQRSATGCLRVPSQLHEIRQRYQRIVNESFEGLEEPPETADIAREIGITERRLELAIRATTPLLSLDAPINWARGSLKGSGAGGDTASGELILLDMLTR